MKTHVFHFLKVSYFFIFFFTNHILYSQVLRDISWEEVKPVLKENEKNKTRCPDCAHSKNDYYRWISAVNTTEEKIEITKLTLIAVNGSYSDLVFWSLAHLMLQYDTLFYQTTNHKKSRVIKDEINDLIYIFSFLDQQIAKGYKSEQKLKNLNYKANELFVNNNYVENIRYLLLKRRITRLKGINEKFRIHCDLVCFGEVRDYLQYHKIEIKKLKQIRSGIKKDFSNNDFKEFYYEIGKVGEFSIILKYK